MSEPNHASRRTFLKTTTAAAAATTLLGGVAIPQVHAAGDSTLQVALVGCGGRGTGAASNALRTKSGPIKLTAMADVFEHRLKNSFTNLSSQFQGLVDVPDNRKFIGFDGYKNAIDSLNKGDIAIFATPPAFRWVHYKYAIEKGINVFMEKPVTVDGPSSRKMLALYDEAVKKNIKTGVGLMCRHSKARGELADRIKNGEMGDLIALRCYRMHGPACVTGKKPDGISELMYQVQRFHSFLWASGGLFSDYYIHNIDECCWMKGSFPVTAQALGGRHYRGNMVDQNLDTYSVEYTFGDGAKLFMYGRIIPGCHDEFASYAHGAKACAVVSGPNGHAPAHARIYKGQKLDDKNGLLWQYPGNEPDPYQVEWDDLVTAIREDKPYNEVQRGVHASVVASMGRMAAHTGQIITFDDMLNCAHEMAPMVDQLTFESEAPLKADKEGKYPVPMPGITKDQEYLS